jgi:hypothetical protein
MRLKIRCDRESCKIFESSRDLNTAHLSPPWTEFVSVWLDAPETRRNDFHYASL